MMQGSDDGEELHQEQRRDDIGQDGDLLGAAGEHLDDGVGDHGQADAVADRAGDGHGQQHQELLPLLLPRRYTLICKFIFRPMHLLIKSTVFLPVWLNIFTVDLNGQDYFFESQKAPRGH